MAGTLMDSETDKKTVRDAMTRQVVTISPNDSAQSAARLMNEMEIGVLPVEVPGTGMVVGIVTDRDLVTSVIAGGLSGSTAVYEFMTVSAEVCHPDDDLKTAIEKMSDLDLRRLVVVDSDLHVVGVISRSDVMRAQTEEGV
ncbi:MAG TPA: CBS domain-containing protein [Mycoplana sp.]|jgi:CBS domain-containing protein|nr:CBS domain-containing protein [Mycoplana sp.]